MDLAVVSVYVILNFFSGFFFFFMCYTLLQEKMPLGKTAAVAAVYALVSPLFTGTSYGIQDRWPGIAVLYSQFINVSVNVAAMLVLRPKDKRNTVFYTIITYVWWFGAIATGTFLATVIIPGSRITSGIHVWFWTNFSILIFVAFSFRKICGIFTLSRITRFLSNKLTTNAYLILIYSAVILLLSLFSILKDTEAGTNVIASVTGFILILVLISVYYNAGNQMRNEENMMYQASMLTQQQMYIHSLEDIQRQLRVFKHDYQNMMSAMYLQTKQGDIRSLEASLHQMMDDFDENIAQKMNLTNQLMNIRNLEIKSLLMTKITEISNAQIPFSLEVVYPVENIKMNTLDFVRCLGILLDNAIEETRENGGRISVILLAQEKQFSAAVSNTIHDAVDCTMIFREGYTSRENHSGLGLFSLERILHQYENCHLATKTADGELIQEIRIC